MIISQSSPITLLITIVLQFYGSTLAGQAFPHPVGFWMFDKQNEGKDFSGNGNDAVLYNTEWTSGPYGTPNRAVKFTGADDQSSRIVIPNSNGDLSVTDSFTWLTMFIDLDTNKDGPIFNMGPRNVWGHIFWKCCSTADAFLVNFKDPDVGGTAHDTRTDGFFPPDEWIKVAVTYDQPNGVIKIYQHDEERTDLRASFSGLLDDDHDEVNIGAVVGDSRELHAGILCTMYFDEALTQEQLNAAFSLCKPNEYKSLYPWPAAVAHWPLNSYFGINNAADGLNKDGVAQYYSVENGPYGEAGGSYFFRQSFDSWGTIDNNDGKLDVNSFTFTAWFKPGTGNGPLFRVWGDASGYTAAPHIWKHSDESQLYYAHYTDGSNTAHGTVSSDTGVLKIHQWNYVAVVYNYGEGMSYLYANDVMVKSYSHGSHVTKMGPVMSIVEYGNANHLYARDSQVSCVQWHNMPLSLDAILRVKNECRTNHKGYRPKPELLFPLTKTYGVAELSARRRKASLGGSDVLEFWIGPRRIINTGFMPQTTGQTITFPSLSTSTFSSFTFAVHFNRGTDDVIELVDGLISITAADLTVTLGGTDQTSIIIDTVENVIPSKWTWVWLGVVYDAYLGVLTVYYNGDPLVSRFVGHYTTTLDTIELVYAASDGRKSKFNCYQFYTEALSLRYFIHTRDACIVYTDEKSVPYPRALWPLNDKYGLSEITGRSVEFQTFPDANLDFTEEGPHGEPSSALRFESGNNRSTLYAAPHSGLDIKFSYTIAAWVKVDAVCPLSMFMSLLSYRYNQDSDLEDHDDKDFPGPNLAVKTTADGVQALTRSENMNGYITAPETSGLQFTDIRFPYDEWVFLAAVYDLEAKSMSVYMNDEVETYRTNRHIQRTFMGVMVAGQVDFDNANNISSKTGWIARDMAISCLQLYDVALSLPQIQKIRDICKSSVLTAGYSRSTKGYASGDGMSLTNPEQTVSANSRVQCALMCHRDDSCNSFAFSESDSVCDMDSRIAANLNTTFYSNTGRYYTEKDSTPWKLFV